MLLQRYSSEDWHKIYVLKANAYLFLFLFLRFSFFAFFSCFSFSFFSFFSCFFLFFLLFLFLLAVDAKMTGHASGRLLIICAVAVFLFYLRTCCWNYNISDAPPVPFWRSCNLIARVLPRCNRIKFPVGEWSKHGRTAIILPDLLLEL